MTNRKDPTPMLDGATQDYEPAATPSLPRPLTTKQRRAAERQSLRARQAKARKDAARLAAEAEEERQEKIAPAAQRNGVSGFRGPRVEMEGVSFRVANPIRRMVAMGEGRPDSGNRPLIRREHEAAVTRLATAREEGETVGMAASAYGERTSGGGEAGVMADAVLASISAQNRKRAEYFAARQYLGTAWPIVFDIALQGIELAPWAAQNRIERHAAVGYLAAALDRLVEFYAAAEKPRRIRGVVVGSRAGPQDVVDNAVPA